LKIKSISLQLELDEFEQLNIEKAVKWLIGRKLSLEEALSEPFMKKLHKKMFGDVWKFIVSPTVTAGTPGSWRMC